METPPVVRRILVAVLTGGLAFVATNLSDQPAFPALVLSLLVGGIVLLVQFLYELERRQSAVETGLDTARAETRSQLRDEMAKIGAAVELHQRLEQTTDGLDLATRLAAGLDRTDGLAMRVARAELTAAVDLLDAVARAGEATVEGEDRDWLLALTRLGHRSLDAISHASAGPGDSFSDDGFWNTEIGTAYLESQRDAIRRGVRVRRLFVAPDDRVARHPGFTELIRQQQAIGVVARVLRAGDLSLSRRHNVPQVALFDGEVVYELVSRPRLDPATPQFFVTTRLCVRPELVRAHRELYADLWASGQDPGLDGERAGDTVDRGPAA